MTDLVGQRPPLTGIVETALYVEDLARARDFYRGLFDFDTLYEDHRLCAMAVAPRQVLLLFRVDGSLNPTVTSGGAIPPHGGHGQLHFAFGVPADALPAWETRLAERGIVTESRVRAARGGTSVYFRDPDGHLVELVTPGIWAIY